MCSYSFAYCIHQPDHQASGFRNREDKDKYFSPNESRMFQVRGHTALTTRGVQVQCKAAALCSSDVFVLETPSKVYLWGGKASTGDEREFSKAVAKRLSSKEQIVIAESKEPAEFWKELGGKGAYLGEREQEPTSNPARLFQCSNARGYFYVEEVFDYDQEVRLHGTLGSSISL